MANFLEDPRLRQRWNQISHNAEAVTENAAAGIWTFQHRYINPCLGAMGDSIESCTAPCFGDRDERARRARVRERGREGVGGYRAEYAFDFYDDWDDDDELLARGSGYGTGLLGGWGSHSGSSSRGEDWDRLVGGSSSASRKAHGAEVVDGQPKRKRGMSYGTSRRKTNEEEDPTIIPSTAPLGFLGRLPWKIGGTLRYKPSAAFLQDHPGTAHPDENQPLLDSDGDEDVHPQITEQMRKRSGTSASNGTSDSYRSRGDLFPSDGEGDEDAVPLDDEFAVALGRVDDRASSNTRSSKGKKPADGRKMSRTISGTTLSSSTSRSSLRVRKSSHGSIQNLEDSMHSIITPSLEDLRREEEEIKMREDQEVARKREAAAQLARMRGLSQGDNYNTGESESKAKTAMLRVEEIPAPDSPDAQKPTEEGQRTEPSVQRRAEDTQLPHKTEAEDDEAQQTTDDFVPARLPNFR